MTDPRFILAAAAPPAPSLLGIIAVALVIVGLLLLFGFIVALLYVSRRREAPLIHVHAPEIPDAWVEAGRRAEPYPLPKSEAPERDEDDDDREPDQGDGDWNESSR